jgi:hypothetical protein
MIAHPLAKPQQLLVLHPNNKMRRKFLSTSGREQYNQIWQNSYFEKLLYEVYFTVHIMQVLMIYFLTLHCNFSNDFDIKLYSFNRVS